MEVQAVGNLVDEAVEPGIFSKDDIAVPSRVGDFSTTKRRCTNKMSTTLAYVYNVVGGMVHGMIQGMVMVWSWYGHGMV